ncbi:MAG: radical SAM family heme chaperone HemW [Bifidobacteriaceae bacterium]|jgi:oxygen-independent coproporphyrinogen-3 oxidase|nr:radical SAM family heme chaperone HemW [Bifidobacteriaceae bacterium]
MIQPAAGFGVYIHVPFCARRCGYCDFNTYVAAPERRQDFVGQAVAELEIAGERLGGQETGASKSGGPEQGPAPGGPAAAGRAASSVFFGGGTPTLLAAGQLNRLLGAVRRVFGLAAGAEVTVEANPDSVDARALGELADGGFNRVSFGMQSASPAVLATLDRTHDPARVGQVVAAGRRAGLDASVDLIYGAPGESLADWGATARAALDLGVEHISAYALSLAPHTRLARRIAAGGLAAIDPDLQADKYELADELFAAAGLGWYEISNWARPGRESRHNLGYWTGGEWLGIGPGAHSALGRRRWWNLKSPSAYGRAVQAGRLPTAGGETLDQAALALETIMLRLRTAAGLDLAALSPAGRAAVPELLADGLAFVAPRPPAVQPSDAAAALGAGRPISGNLVLTRRGRLLADLVTRRLIGA